MKESLRIDSHKLIFHPGRVHDWLAGRSISPIYLEIAPSGTCNHRCIFCALDYLNYKPVFLDLPALKKTLRQAAALGVKSVMYAGEGEPLLHKQIDDIVSFTKARGIDVAMTSNGVLLKEPLAKKILKSLSWIRISLNAGRAQTYARVHRTHPQDFGRVLENLQDVVAIRDRQHLKTTIGVQLLLIPENVGEVFSLATTLKKIGVNYLTIKPYSQHPMSHSRIPPRFAYADHLAMDRRLQKIADQDFHIIFRSETMKRVSVMKDYERCLGLPFWGYIDAKGEVYACSAFLGQKDFSYGNIYRQDFKDIIRGRRRQDVIRSVSSQLDVAKCRQVCRLDKINSYLWELTHPGPHVNFI